MASGLIRALGPPWDTHWTELVTRSVSKVSRMFTCTRAIRTLLLDEGFYRRDFIANFGKLSRLSEGCRSCGFFRHTLIKL